MLELRPPLLKFVDNTPFRAIYGCRHVIIHRTMCHNELSNDGYINNENCHACKVTMYAVFYGTPSGNPVYLHCK